MKYTLQTISDLLKVLALRVVLIVVLVWLSSAEWIDPNTLKNVIPLILS